MSSRTNPIYTQNGDADEARRNVEVFDALLPGTPKVLPNPNNKTVTWREVNAFVCGNAVDTLSGERIAPHFEYVATGERVRILQYKDIQVEITLKQWGLMWDHVVSVSLLVFLKTELLPTGGHII